MLKVLFFWDCSLVHWNPIKRTFRLGIHRWFISIFFERWLLFDIDWTLPVTKLNFEHSPVCLSFPDDDSKTFSPISSISFYTNIPSQSKLSCRKLPTISHSSPTRTCWIIQVGLVCHFLIVLYVFFYWLLIFYLHNPFGYVVTLLFTGLNFLSKLRCEFTNTYSFMILF